MQAATSISLRDKIGQMLILGFSGFSVDDNSPIVKSIQEDNLGGVILFDYNFQTKTFEKNIKDPAQVIALNHALDEAAMLGNTHYQRPKLPLLISVDYEGGKVNRLKQDYGFPATISAKAFADLNPIDANTEAKRMADTLSKHGFNLDFAPVLDVNVNPDNPVIGALERSYSSYPYQVSAAIAPLLQAFDEKNIARAYKHFPGHGSSKDDSHLGFVDVTDTWQSYELIPYQNLMAQIKPQDLIMSAHIINKNLDASGLPATLSKEILTNLLRGQLGFDGVIITDDMQMKAISEHFGLEESLKLAINAGADMFIFGNQLVDSPVSSKTLIDLIEKNVISGAIPEARIDESYQRITRLKTALSKNNR